MTSAATPYPEKVESQRQTASAIREIHFVYHRIASELRQACYSETAVIAGVSALLDLIEFSAISQELSGKSSYVIFAAGIAVEASRCQAFFFCFRVARRGETIDLWNRHDAADGREPG
jgi:predicted HAD superfamily Cof-like phosphohydrolase